MKILYGVQGTGNGHIARARIMAAALSRHRDINVDFVFSGRTPSDYFDMDIFGNYRAYTGLSFVTYRGQVDKLATIKKAKLRQLYHDVNVMDTSGYDLLINDF
ncbi:glycosyltransferase, partial [Alteromonas sp.]|nr:glycosyltransferase [Alteromonas sp.]